MKERVRPSDCEKFFKQMSSDRQKISCDGQTNGCLCDFFHGDFTCINNHFIKDGLPYCYIINFLTLQPLCKTNKFCVCNLQNVLSLEQIASCGVRSMAHCFEITKCKKTLNRSQSFPIVESYLALQFVQLFIEYSFKSFSSTSKQNCPSIKTFAFFT